MTNSRLCQQIPFAVILSGIALLSALAQDPDAPNGGLPAQSNAPDARARIREIEVVGRVGKADNAAVRKMQQGLADNDASVRACAAKWAGLLTPVSADLIPPLRGALQDNDDEVRMEAAWALALMEPTSNEAVPEIQRLLQDKNPLVKATAMDALGEFGATAASATQELIDIMSRGDSFFDFASRALIGIGAPAVPQLAHVASDGGQPANELAITCLKQMGTAAIDAVPTLLSVVKDNSKIPQLRAEAVEAILIVDPANIEVVNLVMAERRTFESTSVVRNARFTELALPYFVRLAKTGDWIQQNDAIRTLSGMKGGGASLDDLLKTSDDSLRGKIIVALANYPKIDPELRDTLVGELKGTNPSMREHAVLALGHLENVDAGTLQVLVTAVADESENVRCAAMSALASIGPTATVAVPTIIARLSRGTPKERVVAFKSLGTFSSWDDNAIEPLLSGLDDVDLTIRPEAAAAIGALETKAERAAPRLEALIAQSEHAAARVAFAAALAKIKPKSPIAIAALKSALTDDDINTQVSAADSLAILGGDAAPAVDALTALLNSDNVLVRRKAMETLAAIGPSASAAGPLLRQAMEEQELLTPVFAAWAVAAIFPDDQAPIALLVQRLGNIVPEVRGAAAYGLLRLARSNIRVESEMTYAVRSRNWHTRWAAADILHNLRDAEPLR
jgi:HEAT repeat protein